MCVCACVHMNVMPSEASRGFWEPNSGPLEEQEALLNHHAITPVSILSPFSLVEP